MKDVNTLQDLRGEYLSDVSFVMDYLQLGFSGATINVYSRPIAQTLENRHRFPEAGSRDALCSFIGHTVVAILLKPEERIVLSFDNGVIEMLLDADNRFEGDAVEF